MPFLPFYSFIPEIFRKFVHDTNNMMQ